MKKTILLTIVLFAAMGTFAQTYVNGYYKSNGTYVESHYRSSPNNTKLDNWSTYGNVNPYTGAVGTRTYTDYNNYGSKNNSYYSYPSYNSNNYNSLYSNSYYYSSPYTNSYYYYGY